MQHKAILNNKGRVEEMYTGERLNFDPQNVIDGPFVNPQELLDQGSRILERFAVEVDPLADSALFQRAMDELNPRYKDGRVLTRFELEADDTKWSTRDRNLIIDTGKKLGLTHPETPLVGSYDAVIAMGAARMAPLDRLEYAASAVSSDRAQAKVLVAAGSERIVQDGERSATDMYAPDAVTEFDLSVGAARKVARESGLLVASLFVPGERAGNIDVFNTAGNALIRQGQLTRSLGAVTTEIYRKATEMDLRFVARELGVPLIGVAGNPSDPAIVQRRTPATYLAEVVRTMRSASALAAQGIERSEAETRRKTHALDEFLRDKSVETLSPGSYADYANSSWDRDLNRVEFDADSGKLFTWVKRSSGITYDSPSDPVGYYE